MENDNKNEGVQLKRVVVANTVYRMNYLPFFVGEKTFILENSTLFYSDGGDLTVNITEMNGESKAFTLRSENAIFFRPNTVCKFSCTKNNSGILAISFSTNGKIFEEVYSKIYVADMFGKMLLKKMLSAGDDLFGDKLSDVNSLLLEKRQDSNPISAHYMRSCLELFILCCLKPVYKSIKPLPVDGNKNLSEREKVTEKVYEYLKANVKGNISLDEISSELFFSKSYLKSAFKAQTGKTILQAFYELKISEAKKMLSKGEDIETVAKNLSFCNKEYFTKVFKEKTGFTPSKFKHSIAR